MRSDSIKSGFERAPHRALLRATGVKEEDFGKPFIAVANSHVDIIPGHTHLNEVGLFVRDCVREAGGVPFIFHTIGICDGVAMGHTGMKYSLPSRELIADSVESMLRAHCFDGMVCIPNCDKIVPGMMMAAVRCDIPAVFVSGGPMEAGLTPEGRAVDLISIFKGIGEYTVGAISEQELEVLERSGCPGCGSCSGMFTANSMNCLAEALGLALPGNGTILATSEERRALYRAAAQRIVGLVEEGLTPRRIVTEESLDNAMILDMAMGGSTNTLLHVMAIAREAGLEYAMSRINGLSERTPNICKVAPSSRYHVEDVHRAGGIMTILWEILEGRPGLINEGCPTVSGETIGDLVRANSLRNGKRKPVAWLREENGEPAGSAAPKLPDWDPKDCIRTVEKAYDRTGGLTILHGNLAPDGSVVKTAGVDPKMMVHEGPAVIFDSQEEACEGILGGKVKAGDVVVIRYEGPRGGPGMQEMLSPTSYIIGMGLGDRCALITDGRFSGGTSGACVGHVSPEAAEGGPIGLLRDGDRIRIDIPGRTISVGVSDGELAERRRSWKRPEARMSFGWLGRYQTMVGNAAKGAVLESGRGPETPTGG